MNEFLIEILEDGRIKVTSPGSFTKDIHVSADQFLAHMKELAGGESVKTKLEKLAAVVDASLKAKQ